MGSKIFYTRAQKDEGTPSLVQKIVRLFEQAELGACIGENDLVAVKMHFGEKGNDTHISPELVRPVVEKVKLRKGLPFLTDTCVLYRGGRHNAVDHLRVAHKHGFTVENVGAPVVISDGLAGNAERDVDISGKIYKSVSVASGALDANTMLVLTHVTGHMNTGIGGAIKNIGMGLASRKGKLRQHSVMKPAISKKACTGCGVCIEWCPEDAISMEGDVARIDSKACIGCGECLTVCRFDAVKYDWKMKGFDLQQRMTEHALGVVMGKKGKVGYMNVLISVTKDCDCFGVQQKPIIPDIGILAGTDPVAIDAASLDVIETHAGRSLTDMTYPHIDPWVQIRHGEEIGLGSAQYELVDIG